MHEIHAIDSHTAGEPTRVVITGGPDLGRGPMAERAQMLRQKHDHFRCAVVNEPRGSDVLVGALVCEPADASCSFGVIYFNNVGPIGMCGHGTIGLMATLAALGRIKPGTHRIDTVVGVVSATLHEDGRVSVENVPSRRKAKDVDIHVEGLGEIAGDVAWGGNWFFLVSKHDQNLTLSNVDSLTRRTRQIRQAINASGYPEVDHIELFASPVSKEANSRNFVLCPGGAYDRSPCGTGTSAKLACLAADGKLAAPDETWVQESILGTHFEGRYRWADESKSAVVPTITGTAFVTADVRLKFDERDPFRWGHSQFMKRISIIGSGVVGLSAAWYCRQRGYDVTVIERNGRSRDNCSFGNAGYITPSHFVPLAAPGMVAMGLRMMKNPESPFYVKPRLSWDFLSWAWRFWRACTPARVEQAAPLLRDLNLASRACYDEFANSWGNDFELERRGLVNVFQTQAKLDHEIHVAEMAHKLGVQAEALDAAGVRRLNPGLQMETIGGVYFPQDWHLTPPRFMATILGKLEAANCQFAWNADVTGFDVRGRRVHAVKTTTGEIAADEIVLAAGAWSPVISRSLGLSLPMQAGKGYSLTMPNAPERPTVATLLTEVRVAVTPMGNTVRFGGTMEIAGLNFDVNPARVRGIIQSACRLLPAFRPEHFDGITPWRGHRPCSPDGLPYLGRTMRFDNVTAATGHAMMGMSLGPISGKIVGEVISGEKPSIDLTLVSPDRY